MSLRFLRFGLLASALAVSAAPAVAAPTAPSPAAPPAASNDVPDPAAIAAARAAADRLIAASGAPSVFRNVTESAAAEVLHTPSGLVCSFDPGADQNGIMVYTADGFAPGDNVGCTNFSLGILTTVYATKYPQPRTAQSALDEVIDAIRQVNPTAAPYEGEGVSISVDRQGAAALPQALSAAFKVQAERGELYTAVRVAGHNGWIYRQRVTSSMPNVSTAQLYAAMQWTLLVTRIIDGLEG